MTDETRFDSSIAAIEGLIDTHARTLVHAFYDNEIARRWAPRADFVGELFVTLGPSDPDRVEAADLIAVHLMGMSFRATTVTALLCPGHERDEVSRLLERIPNVNIWDDQADLRPAEELWHLLARDRKKVYPGINWVTAGKLLARKRPGLIPVVDDVITRLVPRPAGDYWRLFQTYLSNGQRRERVEALRPPGVSEQITPTLRLLDTAIWMRGSRGPAEQVRLEIGLPD